MSAEVWHRAQPAPDTRRRDRKKWEWPLTGALPCECGTPMMGLLGYKARLRYYTSRDKHGVHGAAVGKVRKYVCHQVEAFKSQFEAMLQNLAGNPQLVAEYTAPGSDGAERKALMARLSGLRAEITRFDKMREKV